MNIRQDSKLRGELAGGDNWRVSGNRSNMRAKVVWGVVLCSICASAFAQTYPNRPLHLIVPYPPSGAADLLARPFAQKLSENLGQPVTIDNRGGANGTLGSALGAKAPPDGYTVLIDNVTFHAINATLYKALPYNTQKDFAHVSLVGWVDNVLVVNPSLPAKSVKEFIALAKSMPGKLTYASSGSGSTAHLSGVMFNTLAGVDMLHIPYKGGAPALVDLMAGTVSAYFAGLPTALSMIRAGRLRPLAVAGTKRNSTLPDVPTIAEAGLPGFEASNWYGLMVPVATPREIVNRLNAEAIKVLQSSDVRERLIAQGYEIKWSTPQEFSAYLQVETERWAKVVKASGMQAD